MSDGVSPLSPRQPPICEDGTNLRRRRRAVENATVTDLETDDEPVIEVFSGLYVNEGEELPEEDSNGPLSRVRTGGNSMGHSAGYVPGIPQRVATQGTYRGTQQAAEGTGCAALPAASLSSGWTGGVTERAQTIPTGSAFHCTITNTTVECVVRNR